MHLETQESCYFRHILHAQNIKILYVNVRYIKKIMNTNEQNWIRIPLALTLVSWHPRKATYTK